MTHAISLNRAIDQLKWFSVLSTLCLCCLTSQPAHAQEPSPQTVAQIRIYEEMGITAFVNKQYAQAVVAFRRGYDLSGSPQFLLNIAVTQHRMKLYKESLLTLERLLIHPESTDIQRVTARSVVQSIHTAKQAVRVAEQSTKLLAPCEGEMCDKPLVSQTSWWTTPRTLGVVSLSSGVLMLGGAFWLDHTLGKDLSRLNQLSTGGDLQAYNTLEATTDQKRLGVFVLSGVGAALSAGGLIALWLAQEPESPKSPTAWRWLVAPSLSGVVAHTRF